MAQLIRSAKSGSDWSNHDLDSYHIVVLSIQPHAFFHIPDPSIDHIDRAIRELPPGDDVPNISDLSAKYLDALHAATTLTEESTIDSLAAQTLELLAFEERPGRLALRRMIPLIICGEKRVAQTDVCISHRLIYLILVEDKTLTNRANPEPQVIAEAIATFQWNNSRRASLGLATLDAMTIPCITMSGTRPTFYLVPVTTILDNAVRGGSYPTVETLVLRCETPATHDTGTGMEDPRYRVLALRRFLAFKALARMHWSPFLAGM